MLQPHHASGTVETRKAMGQLVRDNLAAHFAGRPSSPPSFEERPMRAVVIHAAKDLRIEERATEAAGPGEVEVAIEAGGICGSDLHYFNHGGFGTPRSKAKSASGTSPSKTRKIPLAAPWVDFGV